MTIKNIAVISAFPVGLNPGMLSVEFALEDLLRPYANIKLTRYCIEQPFELEYKKKIINYELLSSQNQLDKYDAIVFWGDFLHSLDYCYSDYLFRQKKRHPIVNESDHINKWFNLCMFENNKNLQAKTITFGSTLYGLHAGHLKNTRYLDALGNLFSNSKFVAFRDPLSSSYIRSITGVNIPDGIDCAFFLDLPKHQPENTNGKYALYSFGRSENTIILEKFSEIIAELLKIKLVNINWFDNSALHQFEDKISVTQGASFILTDIYHLSVTSIREKIPSLLFGKGASYGESSLSDKKKEISFSQFLLNRNYIYSEEILNSFKSDGAIIGLAEKSIKILSDRNAFEIATQIAFKKCNTLRSRLIEAISN